MRYDKNRTWSVGGRAEPGVRPHEHTDRVVRLTTHAHGTEEARPGPGPDRRAPHRAYDSAFHSVLLGLAVACLVLCAVVLALLRGGNRREQHAA
ncbi:hypothetical protein OG978_31290 [Streptomyces sp. NBC_01591]|uniref:hypothetical protein n=1 Tax=Streptomyces sp. NBC_01591 TaxID=2975888 RepID=UPI002DDA65FA|nr:hypothetical protein [Streptomyces sp. NBC_01591]WSD71477.1 hypothetical protein OG978_31290 [Streptomyces sp. NBC_01591]